MESRVDIEGVPEDFEARQLADTSIRRKLSALSSLFDYLCERKRPASNANEGATPALGDAQARKLLDAPAEDTLKGIRDRAILATLLYQLGRRVDGNKADLVALAMDPEMADALAAMQIFNPQPAEFLAADAVVVAREFRQLPRELERMDPPLPRILWLWILHRHGHARGALPGCSWPPLLPCQQQAPYSPPRRQRLFPEVLPRREILGPRRTADPVAIGPDYLTLAPPLPPK